MKRYLVLMSCLIITHFSFGQVHQIKSAIEKLIADKELEIGFALYDFATENTVSINGNRRFPMQSVYKLPISIAILDEVDKNNLQLDQLIYVDKSELGKGLWSPIEKKYPNGDVKLPLSEIIRYTITQSDNVGCDLLIKLAGGAYNIERYFHRKGIVDISIKNTEQEIQSSWAIQFDNWATPNAMIQLLKMMNNKELLLDKTESFLWSVMAESSTGSVRDRLPKDAFVAYKTGSSGYNSDKIAAATNCVGFLSLPNKEKIAFAIFITNSKETAEVNASIIADIAQLLYTIRLKDTL